MCPLSKQIRWRKKGEFSFNRPKKHPVNKEATKERRKQQVRCLICILFIGAATI